MPSSNGFNYLFIKRFARLFHVFLPLSRLSLPTQQEYKEPIYLHPLILLLLILINEGVLQYVIYLVGLVPSAYYYQLGKPANERKNSEFNLLVLRSFGLVILNALLKSLSTFLSSLLYVKWRVRLVLYLHSLYFSKQRFYHLLNTTRETRRSNGESPPIPSSSHSIQTTDSGKFIQQSINYIPTSNTRSMVKKEPSVDNPDQRITQDADDLCRTLSIIIPLVVISPFSIGYYTYRTWQITGYYGPLAIFLFFLFWTLINKIFISFVSRTIFRQNVAEGNFRFLHTQIRTHNEPIALYHGAAYEHKRFDHFILRILSPILYRRTWQEFLLNLSMNLYDYLGSILSYLLLALVIFVFHFYDNYTTEQLTQVISQTSFITMYLIYRFNLLNDLTDKISVIAANTHRVQNFVEFMTSIDTNWSERLIIPPTGVSNHILTIKNLSYSTPTNRNNVLMKNLNLNLNRGESLLITGTDSIWNCDSGVGKTSLFRVLHCIWPVNIEGSYSYQSNTAFLLPQRPYFTNLSLHDELSYPDTDIQVSVQRETNIIRLLEEWNLSHILDHVDSNLYICPDYAWQDLLSPGELQRLSFLRLLLRLSSISEQESSRLSLIFLDEVTSSLDANTEMKMYQYLLQQNVTLISIGHRDSLKNYHQFELKLYKNGRHSLENIQLQSF